MKVLFCHNYYRFRGGEDVSFESEVQMLRDKGVDVVTFCRSNEDIRDTPGGKVRTLVRSIHSRSARAEIESVLSEHQPDLMHCNNLFPQISTSIYAPARRAGIPIVQAVRNYRAFCANAFFFRDGGVCTDCLKRSASFASVRYGCYRGSRIASAGVTAMQLFERQIARAGTSVSAYFTPSEFSRQTLISGGFDPKSIFVKPNFIHPDPSDANREFEGASPLQRAPVVFVGRLSQEKGLHVLIEAWKDLDQPLQIVGDGPLRHEVEAFAQEYPHVDYMGQLEHDEVIRVLSKARFLVMPSLWFETFGRAIAESFACGTPAIASRLGAMEELIDERINGSLFTPGDPGDLKRTINRLNALAPEEYLKLRTGARKSFEDHYSREANFEVLMNIYDSASRRMAERNERRND